MQFESIKIDFEVHKLIELNRLNFSENSNDVLRRLLNIDSGETTKSNTLGKGAGKVWKRGNVILPSGTKLQMTYNNETYNSEIIDGKWTDENGSIHSSPSGAMEAMARTKWGERTSLNGKIYWYVNFPGSSKWRLYKDIELEG